MGIAVLPQTNVVRPTARHMTLQSLPSGELLACDGVTQTRVRVAPSACLADLASALVALGVTQQPQDGTLLGPARVAQLRANVQPALLLAATCSSWCDAAADDGDRPLLPSFLRLVTRWRISLLLADALYTHTSAAGAAHGDDRGDSTGAHGADAGGSSASASASAAESVFAALDNDVSPALLAPPHGLTATEVLHCCPPLADVGSATADGLVALPRCALSYARAALQEVGLSVALANVPAPQVALSTLVRQVLTSCPQLAGRLATGLAHVLSDSVQALLTGVAFEDMSAGGVAPSYARLHVVEALLREPLLCLACCGKRGSGSGKWEVGNKPRSMR